MGVLQLMMDGVQKSASFCASLCAEKIVAARREMQRYRMEERRELEKIYGIPIVRGRSASPSRGFVPINAQPNSLYSPPMRMRQSTPALPPQHRTPVDLTTPSHWAPLPSSAASIFDTLAAELPNQHQYSMARPQFQLSAGPYAGLHPPAASAQTASAMTAPAHEPGTTVSTTSSAGQTALRPTNAAAHGVGGGTATVAENEYIDTYDAVENLEEKLNLAFRYVDRLEEVVQTFPAGGSEHPTGCGSTVQKRFNETAFRDVHPSNGAVGFGPAKAQTLSNGLASGPSDVSMPHLATLVGGDPVAGKLNNDCSGLPPTAAPQISSPTLQHSVLGNQPGCAVSGGGIEDGVAGPRQHRCSSASSVASSAGAAVSERALYGV